MSTVASLPKPTAPVHYPDSDGKPMADNTLQFAWITMLFTHLAGQYRERADVFVAGDHLIYPVEGDNKTRQAPDVYVAFGRPKGHRGSYRVWEEGDVFPQVVFEVWSPGNRYTEMQNKFAFYEKYGAEEYYILYPEFPAHAEGWFRADGKLTPVAEVDGFVSPRTGLRFALDRGQLAVFGSDGHLVRTAEQQVADREAAEREAERQRQRATQEAQRAAHEAQRASQEAQRASQEAQRAAALAARLRELGVDPDAV